MIAVICDSICSAGAVESFFLIKKMSSAGCIFLSRCILCPFCSVIDLTLWAVDALPVFQSNPQHVHDLQITISTTRLPKLLVLEPKNKHNFWGIGFCFECNHPCIFLLNYQQINSRMPISSTIQSGINDNYIMLKTCESPFGPGLTPLDDTRKECRCSYPPSEITFKERVFMKFFSWCTLNITCV